MSDDKVVLEDVSISLFKRYSGVEDISKLQKHVEDIYQKALAYFPYRCIRESRFLKPRMAMHSKYHEIFDALKENPKMKLLDLGCCMGTDLRNLVVDKYPEDQLAGMDISPEFIELGYDLFEDRNKTKIHFFTGNILDDSCLSADGSGKGSLDHLAGIFDLVYCGSVLHLLDEEVIPKFIAKVYRLLKEGGTFMGRNVGASQPTCVRTQGSNSQLGYIHSANSMSETFRKEHYVDIQVREVPYTEGISNMSFLEFEVKKGSK